MKNDNYSINEIAKGNKPELQQDYSNLQEIEGYLGCNWIDEYKNIKNLRGISLSCALQEIVDNCRESD